jgi:hypothetical protein
LAGVESAEYVKYGVQSARCRIHNPNGLEK